MTEEEEAAAARWVAGDIEHYIKCHADSMPDYLRLLARAVQKLAERDQPDWFAKELVKKLEAITMDKDIAADVAKLLQLRVPCSEATDKHPYITTYTGENGPELGPLGVLNGTIFLSDKRLVAAFTGGDASRPSVLEFFELQDVDELRVEPIQPPQRE